MDQAKIASFFTFFSTSASHSVSLRYDLVCGNFSVSKSVPLKASQYVSRTHEFGTRAKQAVQKARDQVAAVVKCQREEVIFTSGATESNNLALLGLREYGEKFGRKHIVATAIEHKAVLGRKAACRAR